MSSAAEAGDVGIVGGGYAGLAGAVALARRGIRPTVYEAARTLGGRARTVLRGSHALDNGQHILLGAYRETLALMREVGVGDEALLRLPLALTVLPDFVLRAAPLPAPWHLAVGLLRAQGLGVGARLACVRFVAWARRMRFELENDLSVSELLAAHRQHPAAMRSLWAPLCVAALNTVPEQASARVFLAVLRDGLAADRCASDLLLPRVPLGALFPEPAAVYLAARGGEVRLETPIARIEPRSGGFDLHGPRGSTHHRCVIVATAPGRVEALLRHIEPLGPDLARLGAFTYQPIVTLYAQYAASPAPAIPMMGLSGRATQWLFDRGAIAGQTGLLAAVISARKREDGESHQTLTRRIHAEIASLYPRLGPPSWSQLIEEKRATFACTPGLQRPAQRSAVPGLLLAGDYTEPAYPATLEAAVRSGLASARLAAEALAQRTSGE